MDSRSKPARASALEMGNELHSPVKIHDPACQPRMSAATANVPIAVIRAAIFRNVAVKAVNKGSIRPPGHNSCGPKWTYCEHCCFISEQGAFGIAVWGGGNTVQKKSRRRTYD